jgi:hypothetical protein
LVLILYFNDFIICFKAFCQIPPTHISTLHDRVTLARQITVVSITQRERSFGWMKV